MAGTHDFDPDDETGDWAADEYAWFPEHRYVLLDHLRQLPGEPYEKPLEHAATVVQAVTPWGDFPGVGVAVGYDDGDFEVLHRGER